MKSTKIKSLLLAAVVTAALAVGNASAQVVITEVDPYGSNGSDGYSADWFELTNTGTTAQSITGWTMVDNHADAGSSSNTTNPYGSGYSISIGNLTGSSKTFGAAALTLASGATSIAAGQSVVFLESSAAATASASSTIISNFKNAWFGSGVPAGLSLGVYNDGGASTGVYGLSQTADMVNIFNGSTSSASLIASVAIGADGGTPVSTFDNAAGLNNTILTQKSVAGVNGAFVSASALEIGSPGVIAAVPEPGEYALMLMGFGLTGFMVRRRKNNSSSMFMAA